MIDIVTVVFREELDTLKLQAKSIELYCADLDIGEIIVVINDSDLDIIEVDRHWWGPLKHKVKVMQRQAWNVNFTNNGWVTQQALKLIASTTGIGTHSIILDAKTIFVKSISESNIFDNGYLKMGQLNIYPVFEPSQRIAEKLFNVVIEKQMGPGGVPFIVDNNQVRYMIQWIEATTEENFLIWFQNQGCLTEFILYSAWLIKIHGTLDDVTTLNNEFGIICNLCHSEVEKFDSKFEQMQSATTVSIHRRAWTQLSLQQQNSYTNFLQSRGIN